MTTPVTSSGCRSVAGLASTTALEMINPSGFVQAAEQLSRARLFQASLSGTNCNLDIGYLPVNNTGKSCLAIAITLVVFLLSSAAIAHDPTKHTTTKEKANCEAMHKLGSSEIDVNDPVMRAMMEQCGKPDMENHEKQVERSVCTEERAKLGQCSFDVKEGSDLPPIILKNTLPKIGHNASMDPSAPPHERAYHRKVYEIPDCENMSNMHHNKNTDAFDPIIRELMKKCEDTKAAEKVSTQEASKAPMGDEHD